MDFLSWPGAGDLAPGGWQLAVLALAALTIGVPAGIVGISFGIIRLPIMLAMGLDPITSFGTDLGVSVVGGLAALGPHWRGGHVRVRLVLLIGLPTLIGAFIGARIAGLVPAWSLLVMTSVIMIWAGVVMVRRGKATGDREPPRESRLRWWYDGSVGLGLGVLGGSVGMVLGALRLPALIKILRLDPRTAAGTSNAIGIIVGFFGFVGFAIDGHFDPELLLFLGLCGAVGSFFGALRTGRFDPRRLGLLIGVLVLAIVPLILYNAYRTATG